MCASLLCALLLCACPGVETVSPTEQDYRPDQSSAAYGRARALADSGDEEKAIEALRELLDDRPFHLPGHILYQDLSLVRGGDEEAQCRQLYTELADDGASAAIPYLQSRLLESPGERRDRLEVAIRRDPGLHYPYLDVAELYRQHGNVEKALQASLHAVEAAPDDPTANLALARALVTSGRGADARPHYELYLRAEPGDRAVLEEFLGLLLYSLGDVASAEPVLDRLEEGRTDDIKLLMHRAAWYWKREEYRQARSFYREVIRLDERNARAVLNLGNLLFLSEDQSVQVRKEFWPRARNAYLYYLSLDPGEGFDDQLDRAVFVRGRIARIDRELGDTVPPGTVPGPGSF